MPLTDFISPLSATQTKILLFAAMALIIIPMIGLVLLIGRWFYPQKIKSNNYYLSMSWLASLVIVIVFATQIGQFFANHSTLSNLSNITDKLKNKNINIRFNEGDYSRGTINFGDIAIRDAEKKLLKMGFSNDIESIDVRVLNWVVIEKTDEAEFSILEQSDQFSQENLPKGVLNMDGNNLSFDVNKTIQKPNKYFGQKLTYKIFLPKGYNIDFDPKFSKYIIIRDELKTDDTGESVKVWY